MQVVEEELVPAVMAGDTSSLEPDEAAAVRFAERMWELRGGLDDDQFLDLREHFDEAQVVELGFAVATFIGLGQLIRAFGIPR